MGHTRALADFAAAVDVDRVPKEVVAAAKRAVLDTIGVALFGTTTEWAHFGRQYVHKYGKPGPSTVIGASSRASPRDAALLNGLFAHGFELDDTHVQSSSHPGCVVIPAALAVIPDSQNTGARFLSAVIAGYEVMGRVGAAVAPDHMTRGFHATGTVGVFGAATAAACMMGLGDEKTLAALGIAGSFCSGLNEFANEPWGDMIKRLHAGKAAESGVMAAQLAAAGYRGPATVLEGGQGFLKTFAARSDAKKLTKGLGATYEIARHISFKPYACCSNLFAAIDAIKHLRHTTQLASDAVRSVVVYTNRDAVQYHSQNRNIATIGAAQYSIPYVVAATLEGLIDDPGSAFSASNIGNPRIVELCKKVTTSLDPSIDALFPKYEAARVVVRLRNGELVEKLIKHAWGSAKNPLTSADLERKFRQLTSGLLPDRAADRTLDLIRTLETSMDLSELLSLLRIGTDFKGIQKVREHDVIPDRSRQRDQISRSKAGKERVKLRGADLV